MGNIVVEKVWLTDTAVWIRTADGKEACEKFVDYPRLRFATPEQRASFTLSGDGIHWEEIEEDLGFDGFFMEKPSNPLYEVFISHPELNASAIARKVGNIAKPVRAVRKRHQEAFRGTTGSDIRDNTFCRQGTMFCFLLTPILWRRSVETHICVSASKVSKVEGANHRGTRI